MSKTIAVMLATALGCGSEPDPHALTTDCEAWGFQRPLDACSLACTKPPPLTFPTIVCDVLDIDGMHAQCIGFERDGEIGCCVGGDEDDSAETFMVMRYYDCHSR